LFLREARVRHKRPALRLAADAASALERHPWPGNARELKHTIERAVLQTTGVNEIAAADLPLDFFEESATLFAPDASGRPTLGELERRYIEIVLREAKDNQSTAARILGISRKALWEKRRRYGLK
jgi:transcriptional regulator with PAS, ATPase and Fis domain